MALRITVIGAGPGGYVAAFDAAKRGAEVTLVESHWLGGTCLNCGCVPTKTLKSSAEALETIHRAAEFGIAGAGEAKVDMPAVIERKRKVSATLRGGLEKTCQKLKVNVVMGRGKVVSANLVKATLADGTVQDIEGDKVIIATGSNVLNLPSLPVDGKHILSSDEALELDHVPARLVIVGGGVLLRYNGASDHVDIPGKVCAIADAFCDNDAIKSVNIPTSVTTVGSSAFSGCGALSRVTVGEGCDDHRRYCLCGLLGVVSRLSAQIVDDDRKFRVQRLPTAVQCLVRGLCRRMGEDCH